VLVKKNLQVWRFFAGASQDGLQLELKLPYRVRKISALQNSPGVEVTAYVCGEKWASTPGECLRLNQQSRGSRTSRRSSRVLGGNPGYKSHLRLVAILCGWRSKLLQDLPLVQSHPTNFGNKLPNSIPPQQWRLRPNQCPPPSPAHLKQHLLRGRPWGSPVLSRGRASDLC
jgi:hypothetical protein